MGLKKKKRKKWYSLEKSMRHRNMRRSGKEELSNKISRISAQIDL